MVITLISKLRVFLVSYEGGVTWIVRLTFFLWLLLMMEDEVMIFFKLQILLMSMQSFTSVSYWGVVGSLALSKKHIILAFLEKFIFWIISRRYTSDHLNWLIPLHLNIVFNILILENIVNFSLLLHKVISLLSFVVIGMIHWLV